MSTYERKICVYIPLHITSIWVPYVRKNYLRTGSKGIGVVLSPKAKICLFPREGFIPDYFVRLDSIELSSKYVKDFNKGIIAVYTALPPGYGYAVSAATLSGLFIIKSFYTRQKGFIEALREAHRAEIENSSGLGDVLALSSGRGIAYRFKEGAPGIGSVENYRIPSTASILVVGKRVFHTSMLLGMYSKKVRKLALSMLKIFSETPQFETFIEVSQEFTKKAMMHMFDSKELETASRTPSLIGFYAKKSVLVVFVERDYLNDAYEYLKNRFPVNPIIVEPDYNGIEVIDMNGD